MPLQYRAAVLHAPQTPMSIETVAAAALKPTDVLVRIRAAGLCHTDLEVIEGSLRYPLPIVLGHEAAGVVEQVGATARGVAVGDHVVLSWNPHCGHCFYCDRDAPILCEEYLGKGPQAVAFDGGSRTTLHDGRPLQQLMFLGSFGEYCIVSDQQAIPVPKEIPFDRACLIGCGVMTGVGAVIHTAKVEPGATVAVIGCGGIGLSAVNGAAIAGAGRIIAVDMQKSKLELARKFGATDVVNAKDTDPVAAVQEITGGGAHYTFEAIGLKKTAEQAFQMLRRGGTATIIGMIPPGQMVAVHGMEFLWEKKLQGSMMGSNRFRVDMPRLVDFYLQGRLHLDDLISRRIGLKDVNDAFKELERGELARSVIVFN